MLAIARIEFETIMGDCVTDMGRHFLNTLICLYFDKSRIYAPFNFCYLILR